MEYRVSSVHGAWEGGPGRASRRASGSAIWVITKDPKSLSSSSIEGHLVSMLQQFYMTRDPIANRRGSNAERFEFANRALRA